MTASRTLRSYVSRAAGRLRRLTGRKAEIDYRRWYANWDLERNYWSIVGPATKEEYEQLGIVKRQLLIQLGLTPDAKVLDVGCGTGQLTAALHEYLSDRGLYCGVDISPEAVGFCRSRFLRPNFSFAVSRMTTLPTLRERFHFIVFYSVFTHTYPRETALLLVEANRLLADGGVIFADLFAAPLVDQFAGDRGMMEINPDPLLRMIDASGLRAEAVLVHPGERSSQRVFYKITRKP